MFIKQFNHSFIWWTPKWRCVWDRKRGSCRERLNKLLSVGWQKSSDQLSRQSSHLYCHSPLPPCDQRTKWNRALVVLCFILLHYHSSTRHQLFSWAARTPWGSPTTGCCPPRDHVSADPHYNTIKWLVYSSEVGEHFLLFLLPSLLEFKSILLLSH